MEPDFWGPSTRAVGSLEQFLCGGHISICLLSTQGDYRKSTTTTTTTTTTMNCYFYTYTDRYEQLEY